MSFLKPDPPAPPDVAGATEAAIRTEIELLPERFEAELEFKPKFAEAEFAAIEQFAPELAQLFADIQTGTGSDLARQQRELQKELFPEETGLQEQLGGVLSERLGGGRPQISPTREGDIPLRGRGGATLAAREGEIQPLQTRTEELISSAGFQAPTVPQLPEVGAAARFEAPEVGTAARFRTPEELGSAADIGALPPELLESIEQSFASREAGSGRLGSPRGSLNIARDLGVRGFELAENVRRQRLSELLGAEQARVGAEQSALGLTGQFEQARASQELAALGLGGQQALATTGLEADIERLRSGGALSQAQLLGGQEAQAINQALSFAGRVPITSPGTIPVQQPISQPTLTGQFVGPSLGLTGSIFGTQADIFGSQAELSGDIVGAGATIGSAFI